MAGETEIQPGQEMAMLPGTDMQVMKPILSSLGIKAAQEQFEQ